MGGRAFQSPLTCSWPEPAPFCPKRSVCAPAFVSVPVPAHVPVPARWPPGLNSLYTASRQGRVRGASTSFPLRSVVHKTPRPSRAEWKKAIRNPGRKIIFNKPPTPWQLHISYIEHIYIHLHILADSLPSSTTILTSTSPYILLETRTTSAGNISNTYISLISSRLLTP